MENLDKEFKAMFCRMMASMGIKEPILDIAAVLYLEPEEIAMEEIAKKTGYSLASVSNTMKMLENINMIERRKKPKTKKVFFYMEKDLAKINLQKLKHASLYIKEVKEQLPLTLEKYEQKSKDEYSKRKLNIAKNYYIQLIELDKIINHWQEDLEKLSKKSMMNKW